MTSPDTDGYVDFQAPRDDAHLGAPAFDPDTTPHLVAPGFPEGSSHQPVRDMILDPETGKPIYVEPSSIRPGEITAGTDTADTEGAEPEKEI